MKELFIKDKGNVIKFKFLKWDTAFFGVKSFLLDLKGTRINKIRKGFSRAALKAIPRSFITAKVPLSYPQKFINFLFDIGFRYIDTELILGYVGKRDFPDYSSTVLSIKGITLYKAKKIPKDAFLLGREFSFTRFHLDPNIPGRKAELLWENFIRNFKLSNMQSLYCAEFKNETIGAIFVKRYLQQDKRISNLFLVSVKNKYRNKNIGSRLIQYALKHLVGPSEKIIVETQARNLGAVNFYIKNGFLRLYEARLILHRGVIK